MSLPRVVRIAVRVVAIGAALLGVAILGWALNSRGMPELEAWHSTELPSQCSRDDIESRLGKSGVSEAAAVIAMFNVVPARLTDWVQATPFQ